MRNNSLILLISAFSILMSGCESNQALQPGAEAPAIPVIAASPVVKDVTTYIESIGTLQPSVFLEIRPQTGGTLQEVFVKEGQWVKKDKPLFKIDPQPYATKVQEAEAQLAIDTASYKATQKKLARYKELAEKDFMAQAEWDDLEADAEKAKAAIDLDAARLDSAKLDLEHCLIKSPIAGRIGKLDAHPGLLVAPGQTAALATISKMDPLLVEFTVTEKEFSKIPQGVLQIEIKTLCSTGLCTAGTVTFLDNHFDAKTGLLFVRGKVNNPEYTLRPGQSIHVSIPIAVISNALLIPQKAIRYNQQGPYVFVVGEDKAVAIRQVVLGIEQGADQIVTSGLEPTEVIILDGHLRLSPGIKVDIKS